MCLCVAGSYSYCALRRLIDFLLRFVFELGQLFFASIAYITQREKEYRVRNFIDLFIVELARHERTFIIFFLLFSVTNPWLLSSHPLELFASSF